MSLPTHVPFIAKHPPVRFQPLLAEDVADEVSWIEPPEIIRPEEVALMPATLSPE